MMKRDELVKNAPYLIRLTSGDWVSGIYFGECKSGGGSWGRCMTHYLFVSVKSSRTIEIKSLERIKPFPGIETK